MQTLPFQPKTYQPLKDLEVNTIAYFIASEDRIGLSEVRTIMRARRRKMYEKFLPKLSSFKNKMLEAFEWEEWIAREEDVYNSQMLRMESVENTFEQRDLRTKCKDNSRILREIVSINEENKQKLLRNDKELKRNLRKLEDKDMFGGLKKTISNCQAPLMKLGTNRRRFLPEKKNFDDSLDTFDDKARNSVDYSLDCPLARLKKMSAPKERVYEVQKGFQNEENLKILWEEMRVSYFIICLYEIALLNIYQIYVN